jgi:hypothetical protein
VTAWWPEILAFLATNITNAGTEGTNHLIKEAARVAWILRPRQPTPPSTLGLQHRQRKTALTG